MKYFIKDKKTVYAILLPAGASLTLLQASTELRDFVWKSTGATLPIVYEGQGARYTAYFSIGRTALFEKTCAPSDLQDLGDGFIIRTVGEDIVIISVDGEQ